MNWKVEKLKKIKISNSISYCFIHFSWIEYSMKEAKFFFMRYLFVCKGEKLRNQHLLKVVGEIRIYIYI